MNNILNEHVTRKRIYKYIIEMHIPIQVNINYNKFIQKLLKGKDRYTNVRENRVKIIWEMILSLSYI